VLILCNDASVVVKSLVFEDSEKKGGDPDFKTLVLPPFVQFKN